MYVNILNTKSKSDRMIRMNVVPVYIPCGTLWIKLDKVKVKYSTVAYSPHKSRLRFRIKIYLI